MARVKICPTCRRVNPAKRLSCLGCNVQIGKVPSVAEQTAVSVPPPLLEPEDTTTLCPNPTCSQPNPSSETRCRYCNTSLSNASIRRVGLLIWPWGESQLTGALVVGRDPELSPLAAKLTPYGSVSGRHAEIRIIDDDALLRDLGSTNGTYVNNNSEPINQGEWVSLRDGDSIHFARHGPIAILKFIPKDE